MVDINNPSMVMFDNNYLDKQNEESQFVSETKNKLASVRFPNTADGEYITWNNQMKDNYDNFMAMSTAPQRNPYGVNGNKAAMKYLELQKPARDTSNNNPFMNVPIIDYDRPQEYGRSQPECGTSCKKNFYKSLFRSPDDALWNRSASERQFYTAPNTSVPNEQTKFATWLYGNNQVGKSGSIYDRYGYPYTSDSLLNTGVNAASPQNAGQTETNYGTPYAQGSSPWVNNVNYGYGFGGIQGGIPYPTQQFTAPSMAVNPKSLEPHFQIQTPRTQKVKGVPQHFRSR